MQGGTRQSAMPAMMQADAVTVAAILREVLHRVEADRASGFERITFALADSLRIALDAPALGRILGALIGAARQIGPSAPILLSGRREDGNVVLSAVIAGPSGVAAFLGEAIRRAGTLAVLAGGSLAIERRADGSILRLHLPEPRAPRVRGDGREAEAC